MPNNHRQKTAGSPEPGLPALNLNAADGYENQLSATAEMINTSSARGTPTLTLKVNPSLFSCVNISTETSECFGNFIAPTPSFDFGSTVTSSWAVAVLRGQNEHPYRLSSLFGNPRREFVTGNVSVCQTESQESLGLEREAYVTEILQDLEYLAEADLWTKGDLSRILFLLHLRNPVPFRAQRQGQEPRGLQITSFFFRQSLRSNNLRRILSASHCSKSPELCSLRRKPSAVRCSFCTLHCIFSISF